MYSATHTYIHMCLLICTHFPIFVIVCIVTAPKPLHASSGDPLDTPLGQSAT